MKRYRVTLGCRGGIGVRKYRSAREYMAILRDLCARAGGPVSAADVAREVGLTPGGVYHALRRLCIRGWAVPVRRGRTILFEPREAPAHGGGNCTRPPAPPGKGALRRPCGPPLPSGRGAGGEVTEEAGK